MKESAAVALAKLSQAQQKAAVAEARNGEVKSPVAPKVAKLNLKAELRMVWETGQFNGAGMKACEATDDMVAWAARLIGEEPNHRGKRK
jgi:hypothetical protein